MTEYTLSLNSRKALDPACAGGKGAGVAWLLRNGFRVPPGFLVIAAAYRAALPGASPAGYVAEMPVPARVAAAIRKAYGRLDGRVAVRSSMVGEDGALASYAGQLETVLNVQGAEAVLQAVQRCWASASGVLVLRYQAGQDGRTGTVEAGEAGMAVLVQRMIDPVAAGVAFSADPITGAQSVIIESVYGLGDRLVQGLAEPDRFVVDGRGVLAETRLVDPSAASLPNDVVLALAVLVRDLASRRGGPQDVEWAWDGRAFHILQTRPITSLTGEHIYSNRMVSDMAPGLVKPLIYSINTLGKSHWVFGRMFGELIGPTDFDFSRLVVRIHSRLYADMTLLGELLERVGLPANFMEVMGRDESARFRHRSLNLRLVRAMARLLRFMWRHGRATCWVREFPDRHDERLAGYRGREWRGVALPELLERLDALIDGHSDAFWHAFLSQANMMVRIQIIKRWASRADPGVVPSDLLRGLVGSRSLAPSKALLSLAEQARALAPFQLALMLEMGGPEGERSVRPAEELARPVGASPGPQARLAGSPGAQALLAGVAAFTSRYGYLSANGMDFSETPLRENESMIWQTIVREARRPPDSAPVDVAAIREEARRRVLARMDPVQRPLFDGALRATISFIERRERISDLMCEDSNEMRRIFLELARRLVAQGDLEKPEDIFYLAHGEVRDLLAGRIAAQAARERIGSRRAEIEADVGLELPDTICGERVPATPARLAEGQEYLTGISGSSGRAQGYARVVLDPAQAPADLGRSDVLVVPFTDVGWTPLFPGIGAVVAETGGQLSHTAIVAREYGLPAVVSVHHATRLLREGQPVTVDGDLGRVYLRHIPAQGEEEKWTG